ncbi:transposable element Tc1 transposase [Trichonephila clavipes]|nr:transposable element Tc1 transposase [Trichonephila clavipes]
MAPKAPVLNRGLLVWIIFNDESRFSLDRRSKHTRILICRESGSQFRHPSIVEKDHYGQGGLLVRTGIMADGQTDLHVFNRGTLIGQRDKDEILPPFSSIGERIPPIGGYSKTGMSPDHNPIEHAWNILVNSIAARRPASMTIDELKSALRQEWRGCH